MVMIKRYKIYYGKDLKKPMIKFNNDFLKSFGFNVGDIIIVTYNQNKIEIEKDINKIKSEVVLVK